MNAVNAFEIHLGPFRSERYEGNVGRADELFRSVEILDLTLGSSRKSGEIISNLTRRGMGIGLRDALIAGIAIFEECTLVTRNIDHFRRIAGLSTEVW